MAKEMSKKKIAEASRAGLGRLPVGLDEIPVKKNPGAISKDHFFSSVATEHLCRINSRRAKRRNERRNGRDDQHRHCSVDK